MVDFWRHMATLLRDLGGGRRTFVLADANARVGSAESECIGTVGPDCEDLPGSCARDCLKDFRVGLPSTMLGVAGDGATWTSPDGGRRHRLHYIGVPLDWLGLVRSVVVEAGIDLSLERKDHEVVSVTLEGCAGGGDGSYSWWAR